MRYNGKELQETGMYDYGARMLIPDLGRWNGIDQLAEAYTSTSPYAYVANNPTMYIDPDGRYTSQIQGLKDSMPNIYSGWEYVDGVKLGDWNRYPQQFNSMIRSLSVNDTRGGNGSISGSGNSIKWSLGGYYYLNHWSGGSEGPGYTDLGTGYWKFVSTLGSDIDVPQTTSNTTWWVNTAVDAASTANLPRTGFFKYNELWHQTKTRGVSFVWQNKWKNPGAKYWRGQQVKGFQGARALGDKLTKAGAVLLVADIVMSGEIKPSHAINTFMLGASTTGVGSIVAGVWFVADMSTMGVNYLMNGEAKGLGDMIDESVSNKYGKLELYDGLY
ncbi:RHS repeat-associated core domain-containing protein [Chryseobacterium sp. RRHN12]|uniref:RHS repeat-associated core domain-containing protein n=1 Tax=Chryseobacterium sp. RRHN12 TaxID=3437884 RepID=UPI003D9BE3F0